VFATHSLRADSFFRFRYADFIEGAPAAEAVTFMQSITL
jgi:hypothetical protein